MALWAAIGVGTAAAQQADDQFSGFLGDYSRLSEQQDAAGETVLRYVNPKAKGGKYKSVLIDAVQFYPAPKATAQVDLAALNDIRNYADKALRQKLGARLVLATEPGPGVARIRTAITAVGTKAAGLKPYEVLPVGFLISTARGRGKEATISIEIEVVDSMTGERVGAAVRKGVGAGLEGRDAKVRLEHLRPQLDKWIDTGTAFLADTMK